MSPDPFQINTFIKHFTSYIKTCIDWKWPTFYWKRRDIWVILALKRQSNTLWFKLFMKEQRVHENHSIYLKHNVTKILPIKNFSPDYSGL